MFDDDCPPVATGLDTACGLPSDIRLRLVLVLGATTTTRALLQTGLDVLATRWLPLPACCSLPHAMDTPHLALTAGGTRGHLCLWRMRQRTALLPPLPVSCKIIGLAAAAA
jgi:hypothetical protein